MYMKNKFFTFLFIPSLLTPFHFWDMSWLRPVSTPVVQTQMVVSSSPTSTTVTTTDSSGTKTTTMDAPYGVKTEMTDIDGKTTATTIPLTQDDVAKMQQEQDVFQKQMDQMLQDQQKMFDDLQKSFGF